MYMRMVQDEEFVSLMKKKLKETGGYCPCVPENLRTIEHKCICKDFREKMELGDPCKCHCGLYEIVE